MTAWVQMQVFVGKISALLNPVTYVIINVAIVAVIWVGGEQVDSGILTQGKVIALVNYMSQILVELIKMANLIILISKATACMNRVDSIFQVETSVKEGGGRCEGRGEGSRGSEGPVESLSPISPTAKDRRPRLSSGIWILYTAGPRRRP